jgi:hypothetical protein
MKACVWNATWPVRRRGRPAPTLGQIGKAHAKQPMLKHWPRKISDRNGAACLIFRKRREKCSERLVPLTSLLLHNHSETECI